MHVSLHKFTPELIEAATQAFPIWYVADLKASVQNFHWSLIGRFVVSTYIHKETGVWHDIPTWMYRLEDAFYFSYAHTDEYVMVAIDDKKVWIDMEIEKPRDMSLLHKYHTELEHIGRSDWHSFYTMRTAKESLVKYLDLTFDALEDMTLLEVHDFDLVFNDIHFNKKIVIIFRGQSYSVSHGEQDDMNYAISNDYIW